MQLAHAVKDANGTTYNRAEFLAKRQEMMQAPALIRAMSGMAYELALLGQLIGAGEALVLGQVYRVVPPEHFEAELAARISASSWESSLPAGEGH